MYKILKNVAVILMFIFAPFIFSLNTHAYFENSQLIETDNCPVLDEPENITLISSFDISQNGQIAVASTNGFVIIYDQDLHFLKCINAKSQNIYVLWENDKLLIYRWKINQYVEFTEDFSEQTTYDVPLTLENRQKMHDLETKNGVYWNGAEYRLSTKIGNGYTYLIKKNFNSNEFEIIVDRSSTAKSDIIAFIFYFMFFILMGISILIYNIKEMNDKSKGIKEFPQ